MSIPAKECPDCGMPMLLNTEEFIFFCADEECGYTEYCEDNKDAEDNEIEDEQEFRCPHCHQIIEEELLP